MHKVFGIGLPRTGTASLSEALQILGYNVRHYPKYIARAENFDALVDTPICNSYVELDNKYPGSKFILTVRDINGWLLSCEKASKRFRWHNLRPDGKCGPEVYKSHMDLFETTKYNINKFISGYDRHIDKVLNYFKDRSDLLEFDVRQGWQPLCEFLGKDIPNDDFPHRNKSK